jgi:predicted signal transduction protein with EAL and GGDEF domain
MDELFHAADVAMYQAKNAGRNVVRQAVGRAQFTGAQHAAVLEVSLRRDRAL